VQRWAGRDFTPEGGTVATLTAGTDRTAEAAAATSAGQPLPVVPVGWAAWLPPSLWWKS
jgi:hypothetical protein